VETLFRKIVDFGIPTILFSQPYSGHDWSAVAGMTKREEKKMPRFKGIVRNVTLSKEDMEKLLTMSLDEIDKWSSVKVVVLPKWEDVGEHGHLAYEEAPGLMTQRSYQKPFE